MSSSFLTSFFFFFFCVLFFLLFLTCSLIQLVRQAVLTQHGYAQLQVDIHALRFQTVPATIGRDELQVLDRLLDDLLSSGVERCEDLDPATLPTQQLDDICQL